MSCYAQLVIAHAFNGAIPALADLTPTARGHSGSLAPKTPRNSKSLAISCVAPMPQHHVQWCCRVYQLDGCKTMTEMHTAKMDASSVRTTFTGKVICCACRRARHWSRHPGIVSNLANEAVHHFKHCRQAKQWLQDTTVQSYLVDRLGGKLWRIVPCHHRARCLFLR